MWGGGLQTGHTAGSVVGVAVAFVVLAVTVVGAGGGSWANAQTFSPAEMEVLRASGGSFGMGDLGVSWRAFLDGWRLLDMLIVFTLAAVLGAAIAYHPRTRKKASTLPELDQPKTFIMYALVGAVIAKIVEANSAMAFVVFGIGGLMRFRTDVGPAKDTGRVILTAVVGVCCGLKLLVVAVVATAFGWIILWILERETYTRLLVKGLLGNALVTGSDAYRRILTETGCRLLGERRKFTEGQVAFVFAMPESFDREKLEERFTESIPQELRGALEWEVS